MAVAVDFLITISATTFCLCLGLHAICASSSWLCVTREGNPKTGKRTFDNDYWPTLAVTCGHLYLLLNASTGSISNQLWLTELIACCLPMSLTIGAVELIGELNNCSVNR